MKCEYGPICFSIVLLRLKDPGNRGWMYLNNKWPRSFGAFLFLQFQI
jgi:hypothetical protein